MLNIQETDKALQKIREDHHRSREDHDKYLSETKRVFDQLHEYLVITHLGRLHQDIDAMIWKDIENKILDYRYQYAVDIENDYLSLVRICNLAIDKYLLT